MILADKIVRLRKKNGWSQEELAQKMNVSRQAVSKWESAQTVPELEKILQQRSSYSRLAAAGFSYQTEGFSRLDGKGNAVHRF